jgi:predicted Zn-dependent protease
MRRGDYDPREMPGVFVMLDRQGKAAGGAGRLPEWLATHPSPANRVATITTQIAALPQDFSGTSVNRDAYEWLLEGLVFGMNPRQGFFTGSQFLHPDLRFRMTFPDGWTTNNGAQAVVAVSQRGMPPSSCRRRRSKQRTRPPAPSCRSRGSRAARPPARP